MRGLLTVVISDRVYQIEPGGLITIDANLPHGIPIDHPDVGAMRNIVFQLARICCRSAPEI